MKFESLANELILQLFEYLNPVHLFPAFHGLNSRLDSLLFDPRQVYHVDFRSVSKDDFDLFCQQYLPLITNQVVSLHLSDDEETPSLPDHFVDYGFTLNEFTHLKSLTLHDLSLQTRNKLELDFHHLSNLTHLKITIANTSILDERNDPENLMNDIWSLPSLIHCHLGIIIFPERLEVTSSSMKYLIIRFSSMIDHNLTNIFKHTPRLQHFTSTKSPIDEFIAMVPSITTLDISFDNSLEVLHDILRNLPHLSNLTLNMTKWDCEFVDGHRWKQLIVDCLPNLTKFRFLANALLNNEFHIEKQVDEILNTFRTPFWLDEHHWFVQCDWNPQNTNNYISLYTLPDCFDDYYTLQPERRFKSTWPQNRNYRPYNRSHYQMYYISSERSSVDWSSSIDLFPNIDHLILDLPIYENMWSIIPIFDHLTSLEVSIYERTHLSQLQILLNRAPHLYSLSLNSLLASQLAELDLVHPRIRRLVMREYSFTGPECSLLSSSSLGRQCEVLSIKLTDRRDILGLLREMPNLRALTCDCEDDKSGVANFQSSSQNYIIPWLKTKLPPTCSVSSRSDWIVQIWIDKN